MQFTPFNMSLRSPRHIPEGFYKVLRLIILFALASGPVFADPVQPVDARIDLKLNGPERAEFLAEMRQMLASIQGIMQGVGYSDRNKITESAGLSGNRMARATPDAVRAKFPPTFREIGGPTHMMFEELAVRAQTDEMDSLARLTADLMKQCLACHARFRVQ